MLPLLGLLAAFAAGFTVGCYLPEILKKVSTVFVSLWKGLIASVKAVCGVISRFVKDFVAGMVSLLEAGFETYTRYLRHQYGWPYYYHYLIKIFRRKHGMYVEFMNPGRTQSAVFRVAEAPSGIQQELPENQQYEGELTLS